MHIRQTASYGRQADMAVSLINDYVKTGGHLSDIAILYRVKKEASVLVNTLETIGMPFFTRDNVDDIHLGICFTICLHITGFQEVCRNRRILDG